MAAARRAPPRPPSAPPRRQRRSAEEARAALLDAAERQLIAGGPAAVRLQQVAAEVGVSHPTVLHHFGSREALVHAVVERSFASLHAEVVEAIASAPAGEDHVAALLERVFAALGEGGRGRALAWLALSGMGPDKDDLRHREVAEVAHGQRRQRRGARTPPFEDTLFTVLLALYALFAQSVAGPLLARTAGLPDRPRTDERFRKWLARLLLDHLQNGGA
jgi:AcrR family transcriptional regulator